jgi:hypothetical protein
MQPGAMYDVETRKLTILEVVVYSAGRCQFTDFGEALDKLYLQDITCCSLMASVGEESPFRLPCTNLSKNIKHST